MVIATEGPVPEDPAEAVAAEEPADAGRVLPDKLSVLLIKLFFPGAEGAPVFFIQSFWALISSLMDVWIILDSIDS